MTFQISGSTLAMVLWALSNIRFPLSVFRLTGSCAEFHVESVAFTRRCWRLGQPWTLRMKRRRTREAGQPPAAQTTARGSWLPRRTAKRHPALHGGWLHLEPPRVLSPVTQG